MAIKVNMNTIKQPMMTMIIMMMAMVQLWMAVYSNIAHTHTRRMALRPSRSFTTLIPGRRECTFRSSVPEGTFHQGTAGSRNLSTIVVNVI